MKTLPAPPRGPGPRPVDAHLRDDVLDGLRRSPRRLPCKYFYDARGSRLFEEICRLPEYYPTRTELAILAENRAALARLAGPHCRLVELGSGSSTKTRLLLDGLERPSAYVPIDISAQALADATRELHETYDTLEILPVCADYSEGLELPEPAMPVGRTLLFFPGSTIGNLAPGDAADFLRRLAGWCEAGDRLLIGVDLVKDAAVLERAYNDQAGVTAAFNQNLLVRLNTELGADFVVARFAHQAVYQPERQRIEMRLVSERAQTVTIGDERFDFPAGSMIVTEHSYKYRPAAFIRLADEAGWSPAGFWTDPNGWFGVFAFEIR